MGDSEDPRDIAINAMTEGRKPIDLDAIRKRNDESQHNHEMYGEDASYPDHYADDIDALLAEVERMTKLYFVVQYGHR